MKQKENPGYSLPCRLLGPSVPGYSAFFSPPFRIFLCFFHNVQGFYLYLAGGIEKIMSRGEIWKLNRQLSVSGTFGKHCFIPQRCFCKVAGSKGLWGNWSLDWRFVAQTWARTILRTLLLPPPPLLLQGERTVGCVRPLTHWLVAVINQAQQHPV